MSGDRPTFAGGGERKTSLGRRVPERRRTRQSSSFGFRIFRLNLVMVFTLGVTLSVLFVRRQNDQAAWALDHHGVILARSLAAGSEVGAFGGGRASLEPALRGALQGADDVQYAIVYDANGASIGSMTPDGSLEPPEGSGTLQGFDFLKQSTLPSHWEDPATSVI